MKNLLFGVLMLVSILFVSCASTENPSTSSYLLKSYGVPTEYEVTVDEMTNIKTVISPGIVLEAAAIGWNNTCMWLKKQVKI